MVGKDDETLFARFFEGDAVKPGFSGMGNFRGRRDYTDEERTVVEHFFTNSHSNVYAATDNMPNELWALLMGQYARSNVPARDRLLQLFRDVKEKDKTERVISLEDFAQLIGRQGDINLVLKAHLARAGNFIEEFGVDYGHASLRDSGTIRICFEGVSQRATKPLETAREGAYQEQSTRATPFSIGNIAIPFEIQGTGFEIEMRELDESLISLYERVFNEGQVFLAREYGYLRNEADEKIQRELDDRNVKLPDAIWGAAVREKAFDLARYLLPQNVTTSLGMTLTTRRFQDMLTEWQSSYLQEMRLLGRAAQIEAAKVSPILMKYGGRSSYFEQMPEIRRENFRDLIGKDDLWQGRTKLESRLIEHTSDIEDLVLASILFHGSNGEVSLQKIREEVEKMSMEKRRRIAESYVQEKGLNDLFSKHAEIGTFTFERVYDIGAMRDLQRQRGDRQQLGPYSVIGYHMRPEIDKMGLESEFREMMDKVKQFYDKLKSEGFTESAEYVPVMANIIRHITTKDPVQCFYEASLRTQSAGADSYREIAKMEIEQVLRVMPSFRGLIPYDAGNYPLNRLPEKVNGFIRKKLKKDINLKELKEMI